jgi:hypothetical protein
MVIVSQESDESQKTWNYEEEESERERARKDAGDRKCALGSTVRLKCSNGVAAFGLDREREREKVIEEECAWEDARISTLNPSSKRQSKSERERERER